MNTYETYVSLETAKLLKQAGFDWEEHYPLAYCYINDNNELFHKLVAEKYSMPDDVFYAAPTLAVAQRWLREAKDCDLNILVEFVSHKKQYIVVFWTNNEHSEIVTRGYKKYEEALEAGIKKCLEIVLENK